MTIPEKLVLYFSPGACSRVPMIVLNHVGVEFEKKLLVFTRGEHQTPEYLQHNPAGKIPLLLADDQAITQNAAILQWIDQAFPSARVLPKAETIIERTNILSELIRFSADLHPLVTRIRVPQFICDIENSRESVMRIASTAISKQLVDYENRLSQSEWLCGDHWSALDAYLYWVWFRITGAGFDGSRFPAISDFYQRSLQLDTVKAAIEHERQAQIWLEENGLAFKFD